MSWPLTTRARAYTRITTHSKNEHESKPGQSTRRRVIERDKHADYAQAIRARIGVPCVHFSVCGYRALCLCLSLTLALPRVCFLPACPVRCRDRRRRVGGACTLVRWCRVASNASKGAHTTHRPTRSDTALSRLLSYPIRSLCGSRTM